jgi:hypothetical protein
MAKTAVYYWSYDNPKNGDYQYPTRKLRSVAAVERVAPKTTLRLKRNTGVTFQEIQDTAAQTLDRKKGRGILFSRRTGNVYVLDNRSNRKGEWVLQD